MDDVPEMPDERTFTVDEARALLEEIRPQLDQVIDMRAELTEQVHAHQEGDESTAIADLKAMEARLSEILDGIRAQGVQVKGWAPILLDFPMLHEGRQLLLCWLEGEGELDWYHDAAHGFAGRRPIADLQGE